MEYKYTKVAVGGTFDIIHRGHIALLEKAFDIGKYVIIGVTSDALVSTMGKYTMNNYDTRIKNLLHVLSYKYDSDRFRVVMLEDEFGPAVDDPNIEAIVVSKETEYKCKRLNEIRTSKGLRSLDVISIDLILAKDGKKISSTRIRSGEIDAEGNIINHKKN